MTEPSARKAKVSAIHHLAPSASSEYNLNGASFQQDGITTYKGWQYVVYYKNAPAKQVPTRHVCLARRKLPSKSTSGASNGLEWQVITFEDYDQILNDGHNTISLGVAPHDGSIHLSFDNHNTNLVYRHSLYDLTNHPDQVESGSDIPGSWSYASFSGVKEGLPGIDIDEFESATYPRFLTIPPNPKFNIPSSLLLEFRTGMAGLGDTKMYFYSAIEPHEQESEAKITGSGSEAGLKGRWTGRGVVLKGIGCNAYINGIDLGPSPQSNPIPAIHLTWTYRSYIPVTLSESKQQAGPNGPENNSDLYYAWSPLVDDSRVGLRGNWYNTSGELVGTTMDDDSQMKAGAEGGIRPDAPGIRVHETGRNAGVTNQESQTVDDQGGIHVLNRELLEGTERWIYYTRPAQPLTTPHNLTQWERHVLPNPYTPVDVFHPRGRIFSATLGGIAYLYMLLPLVKELVMIRRPLGEGEGDWEEHLRIPEAGMMEVLIDKERLKYDGILSVYIGKYQRAEGEKFMTVLDVDLAA